MELIPGLMGPLSKIGFTFDQPFKLNCSTLLCDSQNLNQIVAVKFPNRRHYISTKLARDYLKSTRRLIEYKFSPAFLKEAFILNVLISDKLTKSSFKLISPEGRNMDMLFNPKRTNNDIILGTILKSLYTKCENWENKVKSNCKKPIIEYKDSQYGSIETKTYIKPYGEVAKKIKDLEKASNYLEITYKNFLNKGMFFKC